MKFIGLVLIFGFLSACENRPVAPEVAGSEVAVAQVGDRIITDAEFVGHIKTLESKFPRTFSEHVQKKELLNELINVELLYQKALTEKLDQSLAFRSRLADLYVQQLAEQARAEVTAEQVEEFYKDNKKQIDQVAARHILIPAAENAAPEVDQEAQKKIQEIYQMAIAAPDKFPELARTHSQDSTAGRGGDLGYFNFEMMVEPFARAAFALKEINQISPIVRTRFGYHIIQLTGDRRSIEPYREQIADELVRRSQQNRIQSVVSALRKESEIEIYEDNLLKLSPLPESMKVDTNKP
jgi:parvulin-like peptidyl-prolyl isomerase